MKKILALLTTLLLSSCFQTEITSPNKNHEDEVDDKPTIKLSLPDTVWNLDTIWDINTKGINFSISATVPSQYDNFLQWNHEVIEKSPRYPEGEGWWSYNQDWDSTYNNEYTFTFDSLEQDSFTVCIKNEDGENEVKSIIRIHAPSCMPQISLNDSWKYRVTEYRKENDSIIHDYSFTKKITVSTMSGDFPDSFTIVDTYEDGTVNSETISSSETIVPLGGGIDNENIQPVNLCNYEYEGSEGWIKKRQLLFDESRESYYFNNLYGAGGYGYGSTKDTKAYPEYGITYFSKNKCNFIIEGSTFNYGTTFELIEFNGEQF